MRERAFNSLGAKLLILASLTLSACGLPGPSVPSQPGQGLQAARDAVRACAPQAKSGGDLKMAGGYFTGVVLGGILVGPLVVASNAEAIRADGEAGEVDRCLAKRGFERRDLTPKEMEVLERSSPDVRAALLNHLVGGGTLASYGGA